MITTADQNNESFINSIAKDRKLLEPQPKQINIKHIEPIPVPKVSNKIVSKLKKILSRNK
jgi:hypothetical protein